MSGGHYLDTGDGPARLDHPAARSVEAPAVTAWRAYMDHITAACDGCRPTSRDCPTANELWRAYADTRHTA